MIDRQILGEAFQIALEAHDGQVDKAGIAYVLHPIAVAQMVDTLELKIVALLHDVLEDSDFTSEQLIQRGIPRHLVEIVEILTRRPDEQYFDYIHRVKQSPMATTVKLADLSHNTDLSRFNGLSEKLKSRYEKAIQILKD